MLGKRKRETIVLRRTPNESRSSVEVSVAENGANANDVFRTYFEANFDPLPRSNLVTQSVQNGEDDSNDDGHHEDDNISNVNSSEWSGISENTTPPPVVEVVEYAGTVQTEDDDPIGKIFQKSFMSSKPPQEARAKLQRNQNSKPNDEDEVEENTNLKHDLDLQRLLRESHLLEQRKKSENGIQRHKATDLRLQSLGSKASLFNQERMPMSHRQGMLAKASSKNAHRRKEARENGIILEKPSRPNPGPGSRRDRGVDVPVVGKFRSGTLQLSRKDVASIQGPRRGGAKRGRR